MKDRRQLGLPPMLTLAATEPNPLGSALHAFKVPAPAIRQALRLAGTAAAVGTGIGAVVGGVSAVKGALEALGLVESDHEETLRHLRDLRARVEQIYGYLATQARHGLALEARDWSAKLFTITTTLQDAQAAPSTAVFDDLRASQRDLNEMIAQMLNPASGDIAFLRAGQGYAPGTSHWIDDALSPFVTLNDGTPIAYSDPAQELQATIWDPGHYIDLLIVALSLRLPLLVALDAGYRASGYQRAALQGISDQIDVFVRTWRNKLVVARPADMISGGGRLLHPRFGVATGLVVGVADPVTGLADWTSGWGVNGEVALAPVHPITDAHAADPAAAREAATAAQAAALDRVEAACGIRELEELRRVLAESATPPPQGYIVDASDPSVRRSAPPEPAGTVESIDLGRLRRYSAHPDRTYDVMRMKEAAVKRVSFRVARRMDGSGRQLGYRLVVGDRTETLVEPSVDRAVPFPSGTRTVLYRHDQVEVFDVVQSRILTEAEEEYYEVRGTVGGVDRHRTAARSGAVAIDATVTLGAASPHSPTVEVVVELACVETIAHPDATIVPVRVLETRHEDDGSEWEQEVDAFSVLMIPTVLLAPPEYFEDWFQATKVMVRAIEGLDDRFGLDDLEVPHGVDPRPEWELVSPTWLLRRRLAVLDAAEERWGVAVVQAEIDRVTIPDLALSEVLLVRDP